MSNSTITTNASFYLTCKNTSLYYCKTCTSDSKCLSCYQLNDSSGHDPSFDYGNLTFLTTDNKCIK